MPNKKSTRDIGKTEKDREEKRKKSNKDKSGKTFQAEGKTITQKVRNRQRYLDNL